MDPPVEEKATPIDHALWFIRDLFLLVVASPIVYWIVKKFKALSITLLCIVWFFGLGKHVGLLGISHQSVFFFPLGAYFSIHHINFVELALKAKWSPHVYLVFAIADAITYGQPYNYLIHNSGILFGITATTYIVATLLTRRNVYINKFLSDASFFVFAAHLLFIGKFMKGLVMIGKSVRFFVVYEYCFQRQPNDAHIQQHAPMLYVPDVSFYTLLHLPQFFCLATKSRHLCPACQSGLDQMAHC